MRAVEDAVAVLAAPLLLDEPDRGRFLASPQHRDVAADIIGPVAGQRRNAIEPNSHRGPSRSAGTGGAVPDTGGNVLMLPMGALSAPRQRKPLESHGLVTTARFHHAAWRRSCVAARSARAAGRARAAHRLASRHSC